MPKRDETLNWQEIDPATLQPAVAKAFDAYKAKYQEAKALREAFENLAFKTSELPATHRLAFSYNFGKLSMAVALAKPANQAGKKAVSFAALKVVA